MKTPSISEALGTPSQWPNWPFLPIKKPLEAGHFPLLAIVVDVAPADAEPDYRLIEDANLFMLPSGDPRDYAGAPHLDPEALERDGWVVD